MVGDLDELHHRVVGPVEVATQSDGKLRFRVENVEGVERESFSAPAYEWRPAIWLCGSAQRRFWESKEGRRNRVEVVADHVVVAPEVAPEVALEGEGPAS